jgi:hypothetical protein
MDSIPYTQFNDSSSNTECIDDTSISIIVKYLNNWDYDRLRSHQDAFFTQIELNKYLMQVFDRTNMLEDMLELALSNHSGKITALNMLPDELSKKNASCLEFAIRVERLAKKEYYKFNELSRKYHDADGSYKSDTSVRTSMKGIFGVGTKSRYEAMTDNGNISPCLYWTMCKFAEAILTYEQTLSDNPQNRFLEISHIEECIEQVSLERLKELLNKLSERIVVSGGSKRHTRRHRNGRSRRHHSKHSHKSVKRSKKGKKIMKSHTRKRHTHARKQNRRRNRSRK